MKTELLAIIISLIAALLATGCAPTVSPETQKVLQQKIDQQALAMNDLKSAQEKNFATLNETMKENAVRGSQTPVTNPIDATNNTVRELHPYLFYGSIGLAVLAVLCLSLSAIGPTAATIPWLAWMKPLGEIAQVIEPGSVRGFCIVFASLMLLPFMKVSAICAVIALVILFIYEMVINKGNLQTVLSSIGHIFTGSVATVAIRNVSSGAIK